MGVHQSGGAEAILLIGADTNGEEVIVGLLWPLGQRRRGRAGTVLPVGVHRSWGAEVILFIGADRNGEEVVLGLLQPPSQGRRGCVGTLGCRGFSIGANPVRGETKRCIPEASKGFFYRSLSHGEDGDVSSSLFR